MSVLQSVFDMFRKASHRPGRGTASHRKMRRKHSQNRSRLQGFETLEQRSLMAATILSEGFEGRFPEDNGWSVRDANSAGTAAYWNDVNSSFGGEGTHGGSWKGYCAGTGYAGTSSNPTYQNSMKAEMSKSINLSGLSSASLSFWYKIPSIERGNYDRLRVYIDSTKVFDVSAAATSWTQATINLNPHVGGNRTLKFEFYSDGSGTAEGAYLDDILVTGEQSSVPAAPSGLNAAAASTSQINLSWADNSNNESGFRIERKTGSSGTWGEIATVGSNVTSYQNTGLAAGTTYYYRVRAYNGSGNSGYSNEANATTQTSGPVNNNFASATVISGTSITVTGSNVGATKESGEPNHAGNAGGKSVWWTWTAPSGGSVQIDTIGSNFDTTLGVYTGSSVSALTQVAADDDAGGNNTSKVNFTAVSGTSYRIAVDGYRGASGNLHVNLVVAQADMIAYRPQHGSGTYAPFEKTRVAEADEENSTRGPGIRINGDDDNGNGVADWNDTTVTAEDDLIEVNLRASGATYVLARSTSSLRVWTSLTKGNGNEIAFTNNESSALTFPASDERTVWVEYASTSHTTGATLTLKPASGSPTGLPQDMISFHTFGSIVVALGGREQDPIQDRAQGTFQIAVGLYGEGYDSYMYKEDAVDGTGAGAVYNEIVGAIRNRAVSKVAIFGYSWGGGSTFDLANRLNSNRSSIGSFTIPYTAYVDAVVTGNITQETRRPPMSSYHVNYYQHANEWPWLQGGPIQNPPGADYELDVETTTWGRDATHTTIDDLAEVRAGIRDRLVSRVAR